MHEFPEGDGSPSEIDAEQDNKIYQCVKSIIGIEKGIQFSKRADLEPNHLGMAKRFSKLTAPLDASEREYWRMHLRKQRAQERLEY